MIIDFTTPSKEIASFLLLALVTITKIQKINGYDTPDEFEYDPNFELTLEAPTNFTQEIAVIDIKFLEDAISSTAKNNQLMAAIAKKVKITKKLQSKPKRVKIPVIKIPKTKTKRHQNQKRTFETKIFQRKNTENFSTIDERIITVFPFFSELNNEDSSETNRDEDRTMTAAEDFTEIDSTTSSDHFMTESETDDFSIAEQSFFKNHMMNYHIKKNIKTKNMNKSLRKKVCLTTEDPTLTETETEIITNTVDFTTKTEVKHYLTTKRQTMKSQKIKNQKSKLLKKISYELISHKKNLKNSKFKDFLMKAQKYESHKTKMAKSNNWNTKTESIKPTEDIFIELEMGDKLMNRYLIKNSEKNIKSNKKNLRTESLNTSVKNFPGTQESTTYETERETDFSSTTELLVTESENDHYSGNSSHKSYGTMYAKLQLPKIMIHKTEFSGVKSVSTEVLFTTEESFKGDTEFETGSSKTTENISIEIEIEDNLSTPHPSKSGQTKYKKPELINSKTKENPLVVESDSQKDDLTITEDLITESPLTIEPVRSSKNKSMNYKKSFTTKFRIAKDDLIMILGKALAQSKTLVSTKERMTESQSCIKNSTKHKDYVSKIRPAESRITTESPKIRFFGRELPTLMRRPTNISNNNKSGSNKTKFQNMKNYFVKPNNSLASRSSTVTRPSNILETIEITKTPIMSTKMEELKIIETTNKSNKMPVAATATNSVTTTTLVSNITELFSRKLDESESDVYEADIPHEAAVDNNLYALAHALVEFQKYKNFWANATKPPVSKPTVTKFAKMTKFYKSHSGANNVFVSLPRKFYEDRRLRVLKLISKTATTNFPNIKGVGTQNAKTTYDIEDEIPMADIPHTFDVYDSIDVINNVKNTAEIFKPQKPHNVIFTEKLLSRNHPSNLTEISKNVNKPRIL